MIKEYTYLGLVQGSVTDCCVLTSLLSPSEIADNAQEIERRYFTHSSTNWMGKDEVVRTLEKKNLHISGLPIPIKPIAFSGYDMDMGHRYDWHISVDRIVPAE